MIDLVKEDDPVLRQKSADVVTDEDFASVRAVKADMLKIMVKKKGIGLAANQVGIAKRFFIARIGIMPAVFVNPVIKRRHGEMVVANEGCLSFPGLVRPVSRDWKIDVSYEDEFGRKYDRTLEGMNARVFQHEFDHLEGKLITDVR